MLTRDAIFHRPGVTPTWQPAGMSEELLGARARTPEQLFGDLRRASDEGKALVAFMRAFCEPGDRLLPLYRPGRGPLGVLTEASIGDIPVQALVRAISPRLVSSKFLEDCGIPFEMNGKHPLVTEEVARRLQLIFKGLIPVAGTDGRVFVVSAGEPLAAREGIRHEGITGSVLYVRSEPGGRAERGERYVIMSFDGLPAALRKTLHQLRREDREVRDLAALAGDARTIVTKLGEWSALEYGERRALMREATAIAQSAEEALKGTRVEDKSRAGHSLMSSAGLKDSTGRVNPQASISRYEWAAERLATRQREIGSIGGYNRKDQVAMLDALCQSDRLFAHAEARLRTHLHGVEKLAIFSSDRLSEAGRSAQAGNFLKSLGLGEESLGRVVMRPYLTFRDRLEAHIEAFTEAASGRDAARALAAVRGMYTVVRLAGFQQKLNLARLDLVNGADGIGEAAAQIGRLRDDFESLKENRQAGHPARLYPEALRTFGLALTHAERVLELKGIEPDRHLEMIKKRFESLDIERRLRAG